MEYLSLKALHIIFIVTWFAGMFYIVRLFIYSTEANSKAEPERQILLNQFKIMSRRLWYGITVPSALITLVLGVSLIISKRYFENFSEYTWLHFKLLFLVGLYVYFIHLHLIFRKIQNNEFRYSSQFLRLWNELATLFLVAIVFLAVVKDGLDAMKSLVVFILITVVLFIAIKIYKRLRSLKKNQS